MHGFFARFEVACEVLGNGADKTKKAWVMGRMTGSALDWLQSLGSEVKKMGFEELKNSMLEHFGGENLSKLRLLQMCKQNRRTVPAFNAEFRKLAAGCVGVATNSQIKDIYIDALDDPLLRNNLDLIYELPLQKLMAKAMNYQRRQGDATKTPRPAISNSNRPAQNPDRKQCRKCNWWFNAQKGETCKCAERANKNFRGKPKVNEAHLNDQADNNSDEEHDVAENEDCGSEQSF